MNTKFLLSIPFFLFFLAGCSADEQPITADVFSSYEETRIRNQWMDGTAEITSYDLTQAHYGTTYEGEAVMIFVSEPFLPEKQVKDERGSARSVDVLKLNYKKNFLTGIYPYSSMTSVFTPLGADELGNTLKVTNTTQDWCGQSFAQLNRSGQEMIVQEFSYFERKADGRYSLGRTFLEDELWCLIRLNPQQLPLGEFSLLPDFMRQRLSHLPVEAMAVQADLRRVEFAGKAAVAYKIQFASGEPYKTIYFAEKFPYEILGWEEFLSNGQVTQAVMKKRIKSAYWEKNRPADEKMRKELGLSQG